MARYVRKEFLSQAYDESGSIVSQISTSLVKDISEYQIDKGGYIHASLKISDCNENIYLDFDATGADNYRKRVDKMDKLIDEITRFRNQYVELWKNHQKDMAFRQRQLEEENER